MDHVSEQRDAVAAVGLAAVGFVLLVATTSASDYGLILPHDRRLVWSVTRLAPGLAWTTVALLFALFRSSIQWTSGASAFMSTLIVGCAVAVLGAPIGASSVSVMASVTYYALTSALLCLTIKNPIVAGVLGPVFLLLQVLTDVLAHLSTGIIEVAL